MIGRMLIGTILLFGILLLSLPKRDDASLKKIASGSMLMCTQAFRQAVSQRLLADESPEGVAFDGHCPELVSSLSVDEEGVVELYNTRDGLHLTLTPVKMGQGYIWSCVGTPKTLITGLCKDLIGPTPSE